MGRLADKLKLSGRRAELLAGGVTVAVLVAVVLLFSALGSPGDIRGPQDASSPATQAQKLAIDAGEALASGDTTLAVTLADQALALDSTNQSAAQVKEQAQRARTASSSNPKNPEVADSNAANPSNPAIDEPDDPSKPGDPAFDDSAFEAEVSDLAVLLPASFSGFLFGDVAVGGSDAQVSGTAQAPSSEARQITWAVHNLGSRAAAESFITKTSKVLYDKDAQTIRIDGTPSYFGTDGTRYATAVYVRGMYVFEVLISGDVDPSKHRQLAINAGRVFPETID